MGLGNWPAGPAWFIWLLLAFDVVAAVLFAVAPRLIGRLARFSFQALQPSDRSLCLDRRSVRRGLRPARYSESGPIAGRRSVRSASRPAASLHYFVYFLVAVGVGAYGLNQGLFAVRRQTGAPLGPVGLRACSSATSLVVATFLAMLSGKSPAMHWPTTAGNRMGAVLRCFVLRIHVALRALRHSPQSPSSTASPSNAYGMYLVHYAFVSWLQYALLPASLPGFVKGVLGHRWHDPPELGDDRSPAAHSRCRAGDLKGSHGFTRISRIRIRGLILRPVRSDCLIPSFASTPLSW